MIVSYSRQRQLTSFMPVMTLFMTDCLIVRIDDKNISQLMVFKDSSKWFLSITSYLPMFLQLLSENERERKIFHIKIQIKKNCHAYGWIIVESIVQGKKTTNESQSRCLQQIASDGRLSRDCLNRILIEDSIRFFNSTKT